LDIDPGTVVANRYRISRPLGRGGMGEVFAAENIRTGRPVAVKLLRSDSKGKSSAIARFRQEARAAGSINSDHVTQVLDVEEDPEHGVVLVFELLEGESLIDRLKRTGPIPFDELWTIVDQVWMGLADAHKVGIVHRDLKPSNIFLEARPDGTTRVKILDFGISKLPKEMGGETLTEMGQSLGTFSFMPPEQIGKAKTVDHRADIYACATMIYQSLTGQLPYASRNILQMVELKGKTDARKLSEASGGPVDPRLEAFVSQGLARDPAKRFQTSNEALSAWRDLRPRSATLDPSSSQRPGTLSPRPPYETNAPSSTPAPLLAAPGASSASNEESRPVVQMAPPIVDATTDSGATLAMPVAHLPTNHGLGPAEHEAPPRMAPRIDAPVAVPARNVGLGGTQLVHSQRPGSGQYAAAATSTPRPGLGLMGTIAINDRGASPVANLGRDPSTYDEPRSGNLQPHPAGYYMPPSVAAALAQQSPRPVAMNAYPGQGQAQSQPPGPAQSATSSQLGLPRLIDDPTSMPASSSQDKTHVYRPMSPAARMLATQPSTAPVKPAFSLWRYVLIGIVLLVVGFGLMSLVMYLR
jgi:eukaryotic-like serine/threonine-protein kinase